MSGKEGQRFVRFDPQHVGRGLREPRQVEAAAAAYVQDLLPGPRMYAGHGRRDKAVGIDPAVLDLLDVRVVPDVRTGDHRLPRLLLASTIGGVVMSCVVVPR